MDWAGAGPLGEEDVEELRSERSIRGLKVNFSASKHTVILNKYLIQCYVFIEYFSFVIFSRQKK